VFVAGRSSQSFGRTFSASCAYARREVPQTRDEAVHLLACCVGVCPVAGVRPPCIRVLVPWLRMFGSNVACHHPVPWRVLLSQDGAEPAKKAHCR
jgi:hypothetical protein